MDYQEGRQDANLARLTWLLTAGDYPTYRRYALQGASRKDEHARFEFGLDCLLDGMAANLGIGWESGSETAPDR